MAISATEEFIYFSFIFMRMSGFILLNPIFGRKNIPTIVKGGMIMIFSFVVFSFTEGMTIDVQSPLEYAFYLLKEFAAGFVLGFVVQLFEFVVSYAGAIMDYQMGLSMATVYDPQNNTQNALSGQLYTIFYILLFFSVDGHLALMKILLTSADVVPYGQIVFTTQMVEAILSIFCQCVILAIKFSFPLIAVEFLAEVGVGILMKMIPQINVFVINIQAKIVIGLVMLVFLFSPMSDYLAMLITNMIDSVQEILKLLV